MRTQAQARFMRQLRFGSKRCKETLAASKRSCCFHGRFYTKKTATAHGPEEMLQWKSTPAKTKRRVFNFPLSLATPGPGLEWG